MDDASLIATFSENFSDMVHVGDPRAYSKFVDGCVLFDVSPDAKLLTKFKEDNLSEFGAAMQVREDGRFRSVVFYQRVISVLYHRHAIAERKIRPTLQAMEAEYPDLFSQFSS